MLKIKTLQNHTSFETAYVIADYPYGFNLRCEKRIWIESNKKGMRVVSCTSNPKRPGTYNKPKASTYDFIKVLFIDNNTGYVESENLNYYRDTEEVEAFLNKYELDEATTKLLLSYLAAKKKYDEKMKGFKYSITITERQSKGE